MQTQSSKIIIALVIGILTLAAGESSNGDNRPDAADTIFKNGNVYAGNVRNPWASDVAVSGGKFVYVGDDASDFIGPKTAVYDLGGSTVIPGIIDGHSHPGLVALSTKNFVLEDVSTKQNLMDSIRRMVAENPDVPVLIGGFWPNELFDVNGPRKEELDQIESDRPLIVYDSWGHTLWANSMAIDQASVTRDTADIVPGFAFYQKDESGEPTGWITESAASVFINHFQSVTPEVERKLREYLDYYRNLGITTLLDAGNFGLDREMYSALSAMDKKQALPVTYHGAYTLFVPDDAANAVQTLKQLAKDFNGERIRIDTLKIFFDGVLETRTAAISQDYLDTPGNNGEALLSTKQVHDLILELEAEGFNLHVHAVGDRATTTILDAVQNARASLGRAQTIRITICHLETVKDADFGRFKQLGVIANFTPHWWIGDDRSWVESGIGDEALNMQRAQPLISDGAVVTFSSDITDAYEWKMDQASPYMGMQVGHTRQYFDAQANDPYLPPLSDRLRRTDLVNGYTTNAAYQLGRSDEIGSIVVGLRADFVVLNQNLFEVDKYVIHKSAPTAVIIAGTVVVGELPAAK
jgi:predicted amidohydrolase YtcJ